MKPRLRLAELPERVKRTSAYRQCQSTVWGRLQPEGDSSIYIGNRGEKLRVDTHTVLLFKRFPRIGEGFHPVLECLAL